MNMKTATSGHVFNHLWLIVGEEMSLIHIQPAVQSLRLIKQNCAYTDL